MSTADGPGGPTAGTLPATERTAELFDGLATLYENFSRTLDSGPSPITAWLRANLPGGDRALDIGCGAGRYSVLLAERYARVLGVDPAENMVEIARRTRPRPNIRYQRRSAFDLAASADGRFDLVFAFSCVFHMGPPGTVLPHLRSLVAPDGLLVVFEPERPAGWGTPGWQTGFAFQAARAAYQVSGGTSAAEDALRLFLDERWRRISELSRPPSSAEFHRDYAAELPGARIEEHVYPGSFTATWRAPRAGDR